jgi:hypothetical protein
MSKWNDATPTEKVIAVALTAALFGAGYCSSKRTSAEPKRERAVESTACELSHKSGGEIPVFRTMEGLDRATAAANRGDAEFAAVSASVGMKLVDSGTGCEFVDRGFLTSQVRVTSGPFSGQQFFVNADFAKAR